MISNCSLGLEWMLPRGWLSCCVINFTYKIQSRIFNETNISLQYGQTPERLRKSVKRCREGKVLHRLSSRALVIAQTPVADVQIFFPLQFFLLPWNEIEQNFFEEQNTISCILDFWFFSAFVFKVADKPYLCMVDLSRLLLHLNFKESGKMMRKPEGR